MPGSVGFGLYLFSFCDFDTKIEEGEQLEAKTTTQENISKQVCSNMPESGGFGLYLASFRDFDTKLEEGEQLEAKTTTQDCFKKSSWAVGQLVSGYPWGEVNCNWTFSAP